MHIIKQQLLTHLLDGSLNMTIGKNVIDQGYDLNNTQLDAIVLDYIREMDDAEYESIWCGQYYNHKNKWENFQGLLEDIEIYVIQVLNLQK